MNPWARILRRWPITLVTMLVLVIASIVAVDAGRRTHDQARSDAFWKYLAFDAIEAEHYTSLEGMARNSDAAVLGRLTAIEESRVFGTGLDAEKVHLAQVTVEIERVLAGRTEEEGAKSILLEVFLPRPEALPELRSALSPVPHLLFLRNKGREVEKWGWTKQQVESERRFYRLVSTQGQLRDLAGTTAIPVTAEDEFLFALAGLPFVEVLARVEVAAMP